MLCICLGRLGLLGLLGQLLRLLLLGVVRLGSGSPNLRAKITPSNNN